MAVANRTRLLVVALLLIGTAVHAQSRGGGGGGGRGRRGGGDPSSPGSAPVGAPTTPRKAATPTSKVDIVGVVKEIAPAGDRVTIAYEEAEALNWPAGVNSFVVAKSDLLKGVTPGEKVRFRLDSQEISYLAPF